MEHKHINDGLFNQMNFNAALRIPRDFGFMFRGFEEFAARNFNERNVVPTNGFIPKRLSQNSRSLGGLPEFLINN